MGYTDTKSDERRCNMRIDTRQTLKDYEGNDIKETKVKNGVSEETPLTIRDVISIALNSQFRDEVFTAEKKAQIFQLSLKIYKDNEVNLTAEEIVLIKEQVGKIYNPLVYGRVSEIIDNTTEPAKEG